MTDIQNPKTITELSKLMAKHGKKALLISGVDPANDRAPAGRVPIDISKVSGINDIATQRDRVLIGTGLNLGRVSRETVGENGLLRQAASLIANPLVRNRATLLEALDPESIYFDISTPLTLLDSKVRLQTATTKRSVSIQDYLELATKGLKKGEIPVLVEFAQLAPEERVGFFRVMRMSGKGNVSVAIKTKLVRGVCKSPEIVVSSHTLVPVRSKAAEKALSGHLAGEDVIKQTAAAAATEVLELAESNNVYERSLIEICVSRTLRAIIEGPV